MLPARFRLRRPKEVAFVLRRGRVIQTPFVRLHILSQPGAAESRLACVVGKNVHALATARHRYQRWLRTVAAEFIPTLELPHDMVWVAKPSMSQIKTSRALRDSLEPQLKRFMSHSKV